jgi:hypothetical protein
MPKKVNNETTNQPCNQPVGLRPTAQHRIWTNGVFKSNKLSHHSKLYPDRINNPYQMKWNQPTWSSIQTTECCHTYATSVVYYTHTRLQTSPSSSEAVGNHTVPRSGSIDRVKHEYTVWWTSATNCDAITRLIFVAAGTRRQDSDANLGVSRSLHRTWSHLLGLQQMSVLMCPFKS